MCILYLAGLVAALPVRERVRVAEILSVSANPFRHVIVIDKGTTDGAYDGQAIVDAGGVVAGLVLWFEETREDARVDREEARDDRAERQERVDAERRVQLRCRP